MKTSKLCTIKRVECFAVADCRKGIIIFKFIVKLVLVGLTGGPVLLVGIICVTAFRTITET